MGEIWMKMLGENSLGKIFSVNLDEGAMGKLALDLLTFGGKGLGERAPNHLLPIFAWRVCLDVEGDSQDTVGYPLHFGLNLRAFFELGS